MSKKRRQYSAEDKFKVALEAAKSTKTLAEIASATGVHPNQISQWKGQLLKAGSSLFRHNPDLSQCEQEQRKNDATSSHATRFPCDSRTHSAIACCRWRSGHVGGSRATWSRALGTRVRLG
jgi:transposase